MEAKPEPKAPNKKKNVPAPAKAVTKQPSTDKNSKDTKPIKKEPKSRPVTTEDLLGDDDEANNEQVQQKAIEDAISKLAGGLSNRQKEEVRSRSQEMLTPPNPDIIAANHLFQIVAMALRHSDKFDGKSTASIRAYRKRLFGLQRKGAQEKAKLSASHTKILKQIYNRYNKRIKDEDLLWLAEDTIMIAYGKGDKELLPLGGLYKYLNNSNEDELVKESSELDHHLWSIFATITDNKEEKEKYKALSDEYKTSLTAEKEVSGISSEIRKKVMANKSAVDLDTDKIDKQKIVNTVFDELGKSEDMKAVMQEFRQAAMEGTFDIGEVVKRVNEGVRMTDNAEDDGEEEEDD